MKRIGIEVNGVLRDTIEKFKGIPDIGVYDFRNAKNVRNPLISKILAEYEENRN